MRRVEKEDAVNQLMQCGISKETAMRICRRFASEEDAGGLKSFVRMSEALIYDDRKEYSRGIKNGLL